MNGNRSGHDESARSNHLNQTAAALLAMSKLFKAARFYPPNHPTLRNACQETLNLLFPLLEEDGLILTIRKSGFYWQDQPVGQDFPALKELAFYFFARLVHRLLFLPELTIYDLETFARCTSGEPAELKQAGGLQEVLLQNRVTGLFLNEIDLKALKFRREQVLLEQAPDEENLNTFPPEQTGLSSSQETEKMALPEPLLENLADIQLGPLELLQELEKELPDQHYRLFCGKLVTVLPDYYHEPDLAIPCKALLLMARQGSQKTRSNIQRRITLDTLDKLASPELLTALINALCDKHQRKAGRDTLVEALGVMQDKGAEALVDRLAREDNGQARKLLSETLVQLGDCAIPALVERLPDDRWYIARNAVFILGRIGNRKTAIYIRPYLSHRDYRVRREAVRALGRIGGPVALKSFQQLIDRKDQELGPLVLIALGTMQNDAAVGSLLRLIQSFDPLLKNLDLKRGAIKALGAIGSAQAAPPLIKILKRPRFWNRVKHTKLRASAAQALGNIITDDSRAALELASKDPSPLVAQIAAEALQKTATRINNER